MADKLPWGLKSDRLTPGSMKNISENKLKAFNIGSMNSKKGMSKREQDDMRKKMEEEETAKVYQDFVESFEDAGRSLNRSWVKGGTVNPDKVKDKQKSSRPALYKPSSRLNESVVKPAREPRRESEDDLFHMRMQMKKKQADKKKSNLELFKEELKVIQEERQERRKMKETFGLVEETGRKSRFEPAEQVATGFSIGLGKLTADDPKGSYTYENDAQTTNLYLGNLNPKMSEQQLCELFGKYGPLASVKIMWPRSEEERQRGRNCGFVAFMNRKDGERALANLHGRDIMSFEMKLGWGKAVPIPPRPVYIPPALAELTLPPPPSGLPFNAQPQKQTSSSRNDGKGYASIPPPNLETSNSNSSTEEDQNLANAVVKVVIPTERTLLCLIHRTIEFVVREGPMFEAMIMNKEINNAQFRFLFENRSPAHVYYRWKLYSILEGDAPHQWRTEQFRMFKNGSWWRPPPLNPYTQGMPEELVNKPGEKDKRGQLTESQRDRLEDMLRDLIPERTKIGDAMVWCLDHAESAEEIVECIAESLSILQTPIPKKIARLFLISDILYNCSAKVPNASFFRKFFENKLPEIFRDVHEAYESIDARLKAEQFKQKVMACFRVWEDWAVYPNEHLINLQNVFLGLVAHKVGYYEEEKEDDFDGAPLGDDVDGTPIDDLDGAPLPHKEVDGKPLVSADDVDGMPLQDDLDGQPMEKVDDLDGKPIDDDKPAPGFKFMPSKWETVDEKELENQAMTTSKWDLLEEPEEKGPEEEEDLDGQPMEHVNDDYDDWQGDRDQSHTQESYEDDGYSQSRQEMTEEKRAKLREIELKVVRYQDEVEAGKRSRKTEISLQEQVQHYRRKLLQKEEEKEREKLREREKDRRRDDERRRVSEWERAREKEREREARRGDGDRRVVERRERSPSPAEEYNEPRTYLVPQSYGSRSPSYSPPRSERKRRSRSSSPPSSYNYRDTDSPLSSSSRKKPRSRSRSPKRSHRSKSPKSKTSRNSSPKRSKRSRSKSRSRSPAKHRHKHKKNKH